MNIIDLNNTIKGNVPLINFYLILKEEIISYKDLSSKKGSTVPIVVQGKLDEDIIITTDFLLKVLVLLKNDIRYIEFISYVCDALLLIDNADFATDKVKDCIESLCDSEFLKTINTDKLNKMIGELSKK